MVSFPVFGLSLPNSGPRENLVVSAWAMSRSSPKWLIVPVVYDMLRFYDLRPGFKELLDDPMRAELRASTVGRELLHDIERQGAEENRDAQGTSRLGFSLQDISERRLNALFSERSQVWRDRDQAYAALLNDVYRLRNWTFRIRPETKRPVIPARLDANMLALEELMEMARRHGATVIVYVAPIRWDVEPPYELAQYEAWKPTLEQLCAAHGAHYLDLDRLVPDDLWGTSAGDIDFMHFQGEGHRILGERIAHEITRIESAPKAN